MRFERSWLLKPLAVLVPLSFVACGGGSSSDSSLAGTVYTGSLSGTKSGTFSFTVKDSDGNGTGSATISGKTYPISTGGVLSDNTFIFEMPSNGGRIYGSVTSSGLSGSWYADLPISSSSATTAKYSGSASGYVSSSSTGGSGSSTSGSGASASCSLSNYKGPTDDIQTYSFCQEAYAYKCVGDTTNAAKVCTLLNSFLQSMGSGTARSYCPNYCS